MTPPSPGQWWTAPRQRLNSLVGLGELDRGTRHNFTVDSWSAVFVGIFVALVNPFISVIAVRMGAGSLLVGVISASWFVGMLLAAYWGHLAEGRPKLPFCVGPAIFARSLLLLALVVRTPLAYTLMILAFNFFAAVPGPAYTALMRKIYPAALRGRLMAYVRVSMGILFTVVAPLGGRILDRWGFAPLFAIAVVFGVLSSVVFGGIREPREEAGAVARPRQRFSLAEQWSVVAKDRVFALYLLGFTIFGFGNLLIGPAFPIFQVRELGLSNTQIASLATTWSAAWLLTYPLWGGLVDRVRPAVAILGAMALYWTVPIVYASAHGPAPLFLAAAAMGAADAAMDIGWLSQIIAMGRERVATYAGLHQTALGVRGTIAPLVGAALIPGLGLRTVFLVASVLILAGAVPLVCAERVAARGRREAKGAEVRAGAA
jgi:MFS family permease